MLYLKDFLPPLIIKLYKKHRTKFGWFGNYSTWASAQSFSIGYDSNIILEKVKTNLLKVKNGEAIYERDSVIFDHIEYSWPLLTSLLWISSQNSNRLNLIDFGGSLGSSYFQNRFFLKHLKSLKWNIIEQSNFVDCGKMHFENETLNFFYDIKTALIDNNPNCLLFSSTLQYIENPYELLDGLLNNNLEYIVFDLTSFLIKDEPDRITIQKIPPSIYRASYPCWFFNKNKFIEYFAQHGYKCVVEFDCNLGSEILIGNKICGKYKGFIMQKEGLTTL